MLGSFRRDISAVSHYEEEEIKEGDDLLRSHIKEESNESVSLE